MFFRSWRLDSRQIEGPSIAGNNIPDIIAPWKTVVPTANGSRYQLGMGQLAHVGHREVLPRMKVVPF